MSPPLKTRIPRNPRAGLIYATSDSQQDTIIRDLMRIVGAGRDFSVDRFDPDRRDLYNVYMIGGVIDARLVDFVTANRDWLIHTRVILFGFCLPGETCAFDALAEPLGDAVLERIAVPLDPSGPDLPSISAIGLRLKAFKDDGGAKLPTDELREHIESFLNMRKHCVLCTGHGDQVRATSVSYKYHDGHVYIMSEGAGKFANLMLNNRVSIAMFAPRMRGSKVAGIQLAGTVTIWHPDSEEYRKIVELKGSDYERLRALPFILWALDVKIATAEFWWGDLTDQGYAPKQVYAFDS